VSHGPKEFMKVTLTHPVEVQGVSLPAGRWRLVPPFACPSRICRLLSEPRAAISCGRACRVRRQD
jgi:hypothetical protein